MKNTFEQQIYEIFGTTDPKELRKLSKDAKQYQQLAKKKHCAMRLEENQLFRCRKSFRWLPCSSREKVLPRSRAPFMSAGRQYTIKLPVLTVSARIPMSKRGCVFFTAISFAQRLISTSVMRKLQSRITQKKIPLRAFGVVEHPTWDDFTWFLESRCFPKTRDHAKDILKEMGLPFYDPLLIIEKTDGRMAGDEQWILILKNKEARHGTDPS